MRCLGSPGRRSAGRQPDAAAVYLTTLTLPDGRKVNHLYYGSGHLHQINLDGQVISDMERDDLHREVYRSQGKLTSCFGYDAMGRKAWQFASTLPAEKLSQVHNSGVNTSLLVDHAYNPIHRRYQYDPAGELVRTLDKLRGEIKYEYEANGQLRSRDTSSLIGSEVFRYDAAANRLDFNARQFDKVKDNRIKQWRDQEYSYDPWGNLIEKRSGHSKLQSFSYDCENRLVRAETLVNGTLESTGEYRYDSLGRRVAKQSTIKSEVEQKRFLWQGLRMLREETPGQSILYLYEPGSYAPLARVDQAEGEGQKVYYFHTDQIGAPLELTDSEGAIVWQATYRSWGSIEQLSVNKIEQNLRFQGQYFDGETGLHFNTLRYYDPKIGRFITQDPVGLLGGFNLYTFAANPVSWSDPWGLLCWNTARKNYWKNEAKSSVAGKYSQRNINRMLAGKASVMRVKVKYKDTAWNRARGRAGQVAEINAPMELHHQYIPQRMGSGIANESWNLTKATPWGHASMDAYRNLGWELQSVTKTIAQW
ncbi:Putative deoxyribonuclease RhsC [Pseudomonas putida]|uniref:Putative deoxyribonuclease RhsC n=4 Tax=Pseudomonas putida group TaxID=136845 RepID=A0A1B2F399_PSEPU|nr:Putative deoxyribonuclease RhsC [Pseudomonas putida]